MRYRVSHTTRYDYSEPVTLCHNEAYLLARDCPGQRCLASALQIEPLPVVLNERYDYFGNRVSYFAIQIPHDTLTVTARSELISEPQEPPATSPSWETVGAQLAAAGDAEGLRARDLALPSPFVPADPGLADYARISFVPGRPLLAAVQELTGRIHADFTYDPHFTTVITPLTEVVAHRRGVCQDFAHLGIACLRALGLAARYVSGYLETLPPPGQPKLRGADASHAWFAVYVPGQGWYDFDPTNDQSRTEQYLTTAWGRDYGDVTPLKGVVFGGGAHRLSVAVDVEPLADVAPH